MAKIDWEKNNRNAFAELVRSDYGKNMKEVNKITRKAWINEMCNGLLPQRFQSGKMEEQKNRDDFGLLAMHRLTMAAIIGGLYGAVIVAIIIYLLTG